MPSRNTLLYITTVLIWGSTWLAIEFQLGVVDPAVSLVWRFALASGLMLVWSRFQGGWPRFSLSQHLWSAALGFCLFCANYLLFYNATGLLTSGLVAVSFSSIVVFNILFGALFFRQPLRGRVVAGAALGLGGIALIFAPELGHLSLADSALKGLLLCVAATIFASFGNLISGRNQRAGIPVLQGTAVGMGYGALFLAGMAVVMGRSFVLDLSAPYLLSLLYLAVLGSVVAFWCYLTLLGRIGADRASYASVMFPVVALALSTVFEGYQWTLEAGLGLGLVVAGNLLVLTRGSRQLHPTLARAAE
ncbi:DMT family transporter [Pararhodospirillum photometricum]|uniref:EamA domain-containing protein n=1 Tax=Pararhodospirillum photometricum DSM 122 TaxID=1150469 RepID=H6SIX2_PARPM|nr:DMT family transporter [Pararhodospirillum photometricum]CCG07937.1 Putative uncharacterized protein [Pararhodospirillum photometricum DSM 122]